MDSSPTAVHATIVFQLLRIIPILYGSEDSVWTAEHELSQAVPRLKSTDVFDCVTTGASAWPKEI